jgi:hypothetical protein
MITSNQHIRNDITVTHSHTCTFSDNKEGFGQEALIRRNFCLDALRAVCPSILTVIKSRILSSPALVPCALSTTTRCLICRVHLFFSVRFCPDPWVRAPGRTMTGPPAFGLGFSTPRSSGQARLVRPSPRLALPTQVGFHPRISHPVHADR